MKAEPHIPTAPAGQPAQSSDEPAAQIKGLSKRFGTREILSDVNLSVQRGQVHALLGANGAGKSSVAKMLCGYYRADAGTLTIGGITAPQNAGVKQFANLGVRVVHQDLGLLDGLSVLENVAIAAGYSNNAIGLVDWADTTERVKTALALVGLDLAPEQEVQGLQTWQRVGVACARALYDGLDVVKLLILDEVTAALPPGEVKLILDIVRRLRALGAGVLYVTHRFEEVIDVADWVSVLRNGKMYLSQPLGKMTATALVEAVVGHTVVSGRRAGVREIGKPVLELRNISTRRLKDLSLTLHRGEICGVIGRTGCGRSALGRTIFGQERLTGGQIVLDGSAVDIRSAKSAMALGIAYVPQDRQRSGIIPNANVRENLTIANLAAVTVNGWLKGRTESSTALQLVQLYNIQPANQEEQIENLSGGNQQKVVLGRWATRQNVFLFWTSQRRASMPVPAQRSTSSFASAPMQARAFCCCHRASRKSSRHVIARS